MTEFALILPIFLLIVLGLLAFGRIFFFWIETNHLASETARWAVVDRNPYTGACAAPCTLQKRAVVAAEGATQEFASNARVCITFPDGAATIGNRVLVKVEKPYQLAIRLPGFTPIDMGITIRGSSTMRIERFASGGGPPLNYAAGDYPTGSFAANGGTCP